MFFLFVKQINVFNIYVVKVATNLE